MVGIIHRMNRSEKWKEIGSLGHFSGHGVVRLEITKYAISSRSDVIYGKCDRLKEQKRRRGENQEFRKH